MVFNGRLYHTTCQELARTAPERWEAQYAKGRFIRDPHNARITKELLALPDSERTPKRVNAIIDFPRAGNPGV